MKDITYRMAKAKSVPPEILNGVANMLGEKLSADEVYNPSHVYARILHKAIQEE